MDSYKIYYTLEGGRYQSPFYVLIDAENIEDALQFARSKIKKLTKIPFHLTFTYEIVNMDFMSDIKELKRGENGGNN